MILVYVVVIYLFIGFWVGRLLFRKEYGNVPPKRSDYNWATVYALAWPVSAAILIGIMIYETLQGTGNWWNRLGRRIAGK